MCPIPPGGTTDLVARLLAQKLTESLGQQAIVDNRGGAGGIIGTEMVARSAPDGYTLLMGSMTTAPQINPAFHKNLSYDPVRSFQPVSRIIAAPQLLVVHPSVAAKSVKELISLAKAKPGQLNVRDGIDGYRAASRLLSLQKPRASTSWAFPTKAAGLPSWTWSAGRCSR